MATGSISQIKLPNGSTYDLKDTGLRSQTGVLSADGTGLVVGVDEVHFRPTVKYFDIVTERTDLSVVKLSAEDYYNDVLDEKAVSNVLYVVEDDIMNAYGQQIKNLAPGTDLLDAVNVEQLNTVSTLANYYMKSETSSAAEISSALSTISSELSGLEDILHEINTGSQS